jgi:hypothetical protein
VGTDRIAIGPLHCDQDPLHSFFSEVRPSASQESRIESQSALVGSHHRVEQPQFSTIQCEANAKSIVVVMLAAKPRVREYAFRSMEGANAGPLAKAVLNDLDRMTEGTEL